MTLKNIIFIIVTALFFSCNNSPYSSNVKTSVSIDTAKYIIDSQKDKIIIQSLLHKGLSDWSSIAAYVSDSLHDREKIMMLYNFIYAYRNQIDTLPKLQFSLPEQAELRASIHNQPQKNIVSTNDTLCYQYLHKNDNLKYTIKWKHAEGQWCYLGDTFNVGSFALMSRENCNKKLICLSGLCGQSCKQLLTIFKSDNCHYKHYYEIIDISGSNDYVAYQDFPDEQGNLSITIAHLLTEKHQTVHIRKCSSRLHCASVHIAQQQAIIKWKTDEGIKTQKVSIAHLAH